jgi:glycerol-3-phosphate dehydrogenase (NAD(P)+)
MGGVELVEPASPGWAKVRIVMVRPAMCARRRSGVYENYLLGAGAWGTALAIAFAGKHEVTLWSREEDVAVDLQNTRENTVFSRVTSCPNRLGIDRFRRAVAGAELLVVATPIAGLRPTAEQLKLLGCTLPACSGCARVSRPAAANCRIRWWPRCWDAQSGLRRPVRAELRRGSGCRAADRRCAGGQRSGFCREAARQLHRRLRIYANDDLVGVEVGGAVKNVLAIATGVCDGLGLGLNSRAALMTRGLAEIARLGQALGAQRETFMGLAGMGDLILTCTGDLSRNRRVGLALAEKQVAAADSRRARPRRRGRLYTPAKSIAGGKLVSICRSVPPPSLPCSMAGSAAQASNN